MDYRRYFEVQPINWEILPQLTTRLKLQGIQINNSSIEISRYPNRLRFNSWDQALADVREHGVPKRFAIELTGEVEGSGRLTMMVHQYLNNADDEVYLSVSVTNVASEAIVDDVSAFLGLKPDLPGPKRIVRPRTAFIAHRFDDQGEQLADRLARLLGLLDFTVKTGRGFSPESVAEKVKSRMESQAIVFVLLTSGADPTWLTQESVLGYVAGKPVFLLLERSVQLKPGLLGDLEYIAFTAPHVDTAFVPILEGLREVGYEFSD